MVKAIINISNDANQILNIVKAKHNLKDKSQAIEKVILDFSSNQLEPEVRPEYLAKLKKIDKQKGISFNSIEELRKHIENA